MPFFTDSAEGAVEGIGAARRIGWMRFVGNGLGAIPIASIILERHDGPLAWVLLLLNALAWPALALKLTQRSGQPALVQFRCMVADSLFGGGWIAFMALSAVPSALFAALLVADKIAAGGVRLAMRATLALLVGFALTWWALGFPYQPVTSQRTIMLSVPFLFVYGIGLSILSWQLARRVKSQNRQLQRLSRMDPLVELANRGFLILRAQQALDRAQGQGGFACLLMLDVDDFKRINDSHGHRAGDEVLRHMAATLRTVAARVIRPRGWGAMSSSCCCATARPSMQCRWPSGCACTCSRPRGRPRRGGIQRQYRHCGHAAWRQCRGLVGTGRPRAVPRQAPGQEHRQLRRVSARGDGTAAAERG